MRLSRARYRGCNRSLDIKCPGLPFRVASRVKNPWTLSRSFLIGWRLHGYPTDGGRNLSRRLFRPHRGRVAGWTCSLGSARPTEGRVSTGAILRLGSVKDVGVFQAHLQSLNVQIPCDSTIRTGAQSPLRVPLVRGRFKIGNRIAVQPMEGWDATTDGAPSE